MKESNSVPIEQRLRRNLRPIAPQVPQGDAVAKNCKDSVNMSRIWQRSQLHLLLCFMEQNGSKLKSEKERKSSKIYKNMSAYIKSRNISQCRRYSRKIISRFKGVDQAILFLQEVLRGKQDQDYRKQIKLAQGSRLCWQNRKGIQQVDSSRYINEQNENNQERDLSQFSNERQRQGYYAQLLNKEQLFREQGLQSQRQLSNEYKEQQNQGKQQLKPTGLQYEPCDQHHQPNDGVRGCVGMTIRKRTSRTSVFDSENFANILGNQPYLQEVAREERKAQDIKSSIQTKHGVKDQQWLQCHKLYLKWQQKLSQTIFKSSIRLSHNFYMYLGF